MTNSEFLRGCKALFNLTEKNICPAAAGWKCIFLMFDDMGIETPEYCELKQYAAMGILSTKRGRRAALRQWAKIQSL